jgi:hypothetical protein
MENRKKIEKNRCEEKKEKKRCKIESKTDRSSGPDPDTRIRTSD